MKYPWIIRDYSWLKFNSRVLFEATDPFNPVLERLKFLSIVTSNLEEFFMIRVAVLKRQWQNPSLVAEVDDPETVLKTILKEVRNMIREQYRIFEKVRQELQKHNIHILIEEHECIAHQEKLQHVFKHTLFPLLTPLSVSQTHPFPTLQSGKLYMVIELSP
ncbi:MAG: RNA degradosome polyphosphate kinase, partial [Brevinematales bacterium]